jgi:hypothetical protein
MHFTYILLVGLPIVSSFAAPTATTAAHNEVGAIGLYDSSQSPYPLSLPLSRPPTPYASPD